MNVVADSIMFPHKESLDAEKDQKDHWRFLPVNGNVINLQKNNMKIIYFVQEHALICCISSD